jgi:opacity protein-like surface antigen
MKKSFLSIVFLVIIAPCFINAQFFTGGNIGLSTTGGTQDYGNGSQDKTSYLSLDFGPMAGYFLSDKMAAGARIIVSLDKITTPPTSPGGDEMVNTETTMGIVPFMRYYAVQADKFSLFGQAQGSITMGKEKTKTGSTEADGPKTTSIGINIFPGVAFDVSDRIALEAHINLFSFGFNLITEKLETEFNTTKETTRNFNFGVNTDNIATSGAITIGAIVKL